MEALGSVECSHAAARLGVKLRTGRESPQEAPARDVALRHRERQVPK